jgi:hypothetical protein
MLYARTVLVLAIALALAALAAHPRVVRLERTRGYTMFLASGLPFLLLGAFLSMQGVLSANVMRDLQPAYVFGLGWIGFVVGTEFDIRRLSRLPGSLAPVIATFAAVPMLLTALVCALVLMAMGVTAAAGLIRDVLLLAACAAASAPANLGALLERGTAAGRLIIAVTRIDQIASLGLLALVFVAFRGDIIPATWSLPRSAWLLMTFGLGTMFGLLAYLLTLRIENRTEEIALLIGAVALAAGAASYLKLAVPVLTALAGTVLVNMPLASPERLRKFLSDVERPLYLLFLFIVGTSWRPAEWQGWVLAVAFVAARAYGKFLAARWAQRIGPAELPSRSRLAIALMPESPIAIVVIFSAATLSGAPPGPVRWAINAVIIGSIATDVLVQIAQRRMAPAAEVPA